MQEKLLMSKSGSQKTFRYMTYLCYLLLSKHHKIFKTNKIQLDFDKIINEWTHVIRISDNQRDYNHFVDFLVS